jgi:hypothetical protein
MVFMVGYWVGGANIEFACLLARFEGLTPAWMPAVCSKKQSGLEHSLAEDYLQWNMVPPQDLQVWVFMLMPFSIGEALFAQSGQDMAAVDLSATGLPLPAEPPVLTQTVWHFGQATAEVGPEVA